MPTDKPDDASREALPSQWLLLDSHRNVLRGFTTEKGAQHAAMIEQRQEDSGERSADGPYKVIPMYHLAASSSRPAPKGESVAPDIESALFDFEQACYANANQDPGGTYERVARAQSRVYDAIRAATPAPAAVSEGAALLREFAKRLRWDERVGEWILRSEVADEVYPQDPLEAIAAAVR